MTVYYTDLNNCQYHFEAHVEIHDILLILGIWDLNIAIFEGTLSAASVRSHRQPGGWLQVFGSPVR